MKNYTISQVVDKFDNFFKFRQIMGHKYKMNADFPKKSPETVVE